MKILIADDDRTTRDLLKEVFDQEKFEVTCVPSGEEALRLLQQSEFPIVLSDIRMLELDGMALLEKIKERFPNTVVILMTGFGTMEGAIQAVRLGAFDYISKPFQLKELRALVGRAVKHWEEQRRAPATTKKISLPPNKTLIGKAPAIVEVYRLLARAALSPSHVLIVGESGTGKELVARAIHDNSNRAQKKFVAINCGALTETLLESELFGHVKGAFTGATTNKVGILQDADGGTLFLDEIGDISPALQVKLLRAIQEGEYRPVGGTETLTANVRIIAATHRDLESMVEKGTFREDLYYRLKVILIRIPPLRERKEDLPELIQYFVAVYAKKIGKSISNVSDEAMRLLEAYVWPGNVRELEHAIEHAITMSRGNLLYPEDFPAELRSAEGTATTTQNGDNSLEEIEKAHILKVLQETNFNKSKAASLLGIDRKTLHRKAVKYGIQIKDND